MNSETLWLQVPAAKKPLIKQSKISATDKLEQIAHSLAALQISHIGKTSIILFVAEHSISLASEIKNTLSCGSKVEHIMAKTLQTKLEIINLGNTTNLNSITGIINSNIPHFYPTAAMNEEQLAKAINIGRQSAQRIKLRKEQIFIASEINNANILSAAAITCALFDLPVEQLNEFDREKNKLIDQALNKHEDKLTSPLEILRCLGSFEIAALTGSYLCCAHMGMPILISGVASSVAALITTKLCPQAEQWFLYSQSSNNATHAFILKTLKAKPLLQLEARFDTHLDNLSAIITTLSLLQRACTHATRNDH